tara:strand:+ start:7 stop:642 length:636 start_codon:yes stop_codon:yes gene_type:complete
MLDDFVRKIRDIPKNSGRKYITKFFSKYIRAASVQARCDVDIILRFCTEREVAHFVECDRKTQERVNFKPILNDEYVALQTIDGCIISVIGLSRERDYIEITSDTVKSQQRKGYNKILRAFAFIVAYVERKQLKSFVANTTSAYTLLNTFQTNVKTKEGEIFSFPTPLEKDSATRLAPITKGGVLFIRPTLFNLRAAARILFDKLLEFPCN